MPLAKLCLSARERVRGAAAVVRCGRSLGVVLLACAALLLVAPGAALASVVTMPGTTLVYTAASGELNELSLSRTSDGEYDLVDPGVSITAPSACTTVAPGHVRCPGGSVVSVRILLADLDDDLVIADSAYPSAPGPIPIQAEGGPGGDTLTGAAGSDRLFGGSGSDTVSGGGGADGVAGGVNSPLTDPGVDGGDIVDAGAGDDTFVFGGPGQDELSAGSGEDRVVNGGEGDDLAMGGPGDDDIVGGPGADRLEGGDGSDLVDVGAALIGAVTEDTDLLGSDMLDGGAGDDRIGVERLGPFQPDVLGGGAGLDTVTYASRIVSLSVSIDGLPNDGQSGEGDNVLPDVEQLTGGAESDTLVGSSAAELLDGGPGDDQLAGLGGDDKLEGGPNDGGSDSLQGGAGRDTMQGGPGDDSLEAGDDDDRASGGGGSDSVAGDAGQDEVAGGPGLDSVAGGDGHDTVRGGEAVLVGADGADSLDGGPGNDNLLAGPGNDTLDGGVGADRIGGEAGRDTVTYESRFVAVSVTFDGLANDGEPGEGDNVDGDVEAVIGSALADTLTGDVRDNLLAAGAGEDRLDGAAGSDVLRGGRAPDVVRARDNSVDMVDCGPDGDLAILDPADRTRDCENLDVAGRRRPVLGRAALVRTSRGNAAFRLPRARRFTPLQELLQLPLGTTIDARAARVRLTTARNRRGTRQSAVFSDGAFSVRQPRKRARGRITDIRLRGGDFSACTSTATPGRAVAAAARKRRVRYLWGNGGGRFRTRGRYSAGVVRGTTWLTEDRCDGTLTRVVTGTVVVRDFTLRRTVIVRAGESYLAPARRPAGE